MLSPATMKPDTIPVVMTMNRNMTIYFPSSSFSSFGILLHNGFLITDPLSY